MLRCPPTKGISHPQFYPKRIFLPVIGVRCTLLLIIVTASVNFRLEVVCSYFLSTALLRADRTIVKDSSTDLPCIGPRVASQLTMSRVLLQQLLFIHRVQLLAMRLQYQLEETMDGPG